MDGGIAQQIGRIETVGDAGFRVHFFPEVTSTNDLARTAAPWTAIVAESQTDGRGRHGRRFESGPGGMWLSAILPAPGGSTAWNGFSLAAGLRLMSALNRLPLPEPTRLRWPNDLLVGQQKLGGLLIEQKATLIVGLGLNITNHPGDADPELRTSACRLADFLDPCPEPRVVLDLALNAFTSAHEDLPRVGLAAIAEEFNAAMEEPREVAVIPTEGAGIRGTFYGIDSEGNLRIDDRIIPHQDTKQLIEITN